MRHLLVPIPHVHLESAIHAFDEKGAVALGSKQLDIFESLNDGTETKVWLCVSTGYVPGGHVFNGQIGKVVYAGKLVSAEMGDRRGRCLTPELRPASTGGDTEWTFFYRISDIEKLSSPIPSAKFRRIGGGSVETAPHMLVFINPPEVS